MIFIDKINNTIAIAKDLYLRLPKRIQRERYPNHIIYTLTTNFTTISRARFFVDFRLGETQIWIYTECAGMSINLPDIFCII